MKQIVKIIILNEKNKLLLYLRDNKESIPYPGYWDFIGGAVEDGESHIEAIQREIKEEIGIIIKKIDFLDKLFFIKDPLSKGIDFEVNLFTGIANNNLDEIKLTEGQAINFFDIEELDKLRFSPKYLEFILKNKDQIFK